MALAFYTVCTSGLALVALERAVRSGDRFPMRPLAAYAAGGACVAIACAMQGIVTPKALVLLACVVISAVTDCSSGRIYNSVLAAALGLIAVFGFVDDAASLVCGGAGGLGISAALFFASAGRGLGFGDVKLFGVSGLALGAPAILVCIGSAFVIGAVYSLALLGASRVKRSTQLPFAPYIAMGAMAAICWRPVVA